MNNPDDPGHPLNQEIDDSQNPTAASPEVGSAGTSDGGDSYGEPEEPQRSRQQEMLRQLQEMIDNLAREARPVMREFAAKSAELAALAAERAGPLAAKAAEKTQVYGERVAARSKEMAADLRRQAGTESAAEPTPETTTEAGEGTPH